MDNTTRGLEDRAGTSGAQGARGAAGVTDPETDRRTRQIEQEIRETREELSETIDAIQDRLRPSNIVADATDRVKTATTEKVKSMAETASETAQGMMRETRDRAYDIVEGARENPIPALMIGAGVAWMLIGRTTGSGNGRAWREDNRWSRSRSSSPGSGYTEADGYYRSASGARSYGDERALSGTRSYGDEGSDLTGRAREAAEGARQTARRVQNQFQRLLYDNPLLVGAAAVVVGAAVGAALPETDRENEWLGETRDSMVDRAQKMARNAAESVQEVATDAIGEVAERVVPGDE